MELLSSVLIEGSLTVLGRQVRPRHTRGLWIVSGPFALPPYLAGFESRLFFPSFTFVS
jgi:hypothetical protein